ncbi:hypothetical protein SAMN05892883_2107 [Jatrophihabitans sp. GAS493]|uniref:hypothetical protein n=1 Tax=Jatrophihabitans sp. GAS493 TaxID=1907575 RepID=UPI000BB8FF33|nr:hypothetical protein [Jatrophihabitans sp. GAS493]SOD72765.1 hypothetical protein SAMN05892883_2107 [Jatrophihabitans sp. GAS493]
MDTDYSAYPAQAISDELAEYHEDASLKALLPHLSEQRLADLTEDLVANRAQFDELTYNPGDFMATYMCGLGAVQSRLDTLADEYDALIADAIAANVAAGRAAA